MPLAPLIGHPRAVRDDLWRMNGHLILLAAVLTLIEAIGLLTDSSLITRGRDDWPQIYPYTVAGMAIIVLALALYRRGHPVTDWVARGLAIVTVVLGVGVDLLVSLEVLPSSDPTSSQVDWWVTFLPSAAITCITVATVLIRLGGDRVARVRFWMAVAGGAMSLLGLMSYLYESVALFTNLGVTGLSLPTSVIGLVIVGAVMTAQPDRPPLAALDERYDRSLMRRILPMLIVAPLLPATVEWVILRFAPDARAAAAVSGLVTAVILVVVISTVGGAQSRAQRELTTQRQRVWDAFEHSPAATAIVTVDGRIATANGAMARLVHRPVDELVDTLVSDLVSPHDQLAVVNALVDVGAGREGFRRDVRLAGGGQAPTWIDLGVAPVRDIGGKVGYVVLQCTDLTDRKNLERVLADQAIRDPLTGLLNRQGMDLAIEERRGTMHRGQVLVIVYADVDGLKPLNDSIGHAAGDDLLREVARRLRAITRENDVLARIGGDEFVVVTAVPADHEAPAEAVVSRLRTHLTGPVAVGSHVTELSVSLGASVLDAADTKVAFAEADRAMYADKRLRRRATDVDA